jgi:hypothetical protein
MFAGTDTEKDLKASYVKIQFHGSEQKDAVTYITVLWLPATMY